jgi:AraC-like DNA-binding protein
METQTMEETKRFQSIPNMHVCTAQLIDCLKDGQVGDVLTDEDLTRICGKSTKVDGDGYGYLNSAIRYVLKQHGIVWKRDRGANAIKCLNADEIIQSSEQDRKHIHRVGKRTVRRLGTVDIERLPVSTRKAHTLQLAQMATVVGMSSKNTQKKLEVREKVEPMDVAKMIELWPSRNKARYTEENTND